MQQTIPFKWKDVFYDLTNKSLLFNGREVIKDFYKKYDKVKVVWNYLNLILKDKEMNFSLYSLINEKFVIENKNFINIPFDLSCIVFQDKGTASDQFQVGRFDNAVNHTFIADNVIPLWWNKVLVKTKIDSNKYQYKVIDILTNDTIHFDKEEVLKYNQKEWTLLVVSWLYTPWYWTFKIFDFVNNKVLVDKLKDVKTHDFLGLYIAYIEENDTFKFISKSGEVKKTLPTGSILFPYHPLGYFYYKNDNRYTLLDSELKEVFVDVDFIEYSEGKDNIAIYLKGGMVLHITKDGIITDTDAFYELNTI